MKKIFKGVISTLVILVSFNLQADAPKNECKRLFDEYLYDKALAPCSKIAATGDNSAQTMLGEIYDEKGNSEKTAFWWNLAADAGYQPARNLLALKYFYGGTVLGPEKGWKLDYKKAYAIWKLDADQGVATSQFMIAIMYQKGLGVTKNLSEAWFWLKVSLGNGYKLSTDVMIEISRDISAEQKQLAEKKFAKYKLENASKKNG